MTEYTDPKTVNKDAMLGRAQSGAAWSGIPIMSQIGAKVGMMAAKRLGPVLGMDPVGRKAKKKKKKKKNGPY